MKMLTELHVHNSQRFRRVREPVTTGVPVPADIGLLDVNRLALSDEQGQFVPLQCMPLAWWQDGSVKWAAVHLQVDVMAGTSRSYCLLLLDEVSAQPEGVPLASRQGDSIHVDTGCLKFVLGRVPGCFREFSYCTQGKWVNLTPEFGPSLQLENGRRLCLGPPAETVIEENGTERTVIKISGCFVFDGQDGGLVNLDEAEFIYELWLEAYRGLPDLKVTHSLIRRRQGAAVSGLAWHIPALHAGYYAAPVGGGEEVKLHLSGGSKEVLGILQENEEEVVCGILDNLETGDRTRVKGKHSWWMSARTEESAISATVRWMAQKYPKSLECTVHGINIGLLPHLSGTKDSSCPGGQRKSFYELQVGEARTHEMLIRFDEAGGAKPNPYPAEASLDTAERMAGFHAPLLALAPWEWYTGSRTLGDLLPRAADPRFAAYEQSVDDSLAVYLSRRESFKLYGDRNFGDDLYGKPGCWNNGEYDYTHVGMLHTLRGAGLEWYEQFTLPYATHLMDIDICRAGPAAGYIYQHSESHNSEPPKLGSHAWIRGLLEYYCFSGDLRAREAARQVADVWSGDIIRRGVGEGTERGITWPVLSMLAMYETIPEPKYLQAASILIRTVLDAHDPEEGDFKKVMSRPTTKDNWGTFVIGSPVLESLIWYHQITGDEQAKNAVVRAAKRLASKNWLEEIGAWEYTHSKLHGHERAHNAKTDKMVTPAVLYAYLFSGEEELLNKALRAFRHSETIPAHNGKDLGQSYCFGIRIPALLDKAWNRKASEQPFQ